MPTHGVKFPLASPGRRLILAAAAGAGLGRSAFAQGDGRYPSRPVRIVVPNPPAGSTDIVARVLAERLAARLGQNFVVENRPGAGGNIGMEQVARSAPDGYTLGAATVTQWVVNDFLYERMSYNTRRDLAYISMNWELANILSVPAAHVPATTVQEFIAWAKAQPSGVTFGTPGIGTSSHLLSELLGRRYGINVVHMPFRGGGEAVPAMLRGDIKFSMDGLATYLPVVRDGLVRALAITSSERSPLVPNTPTMAELGMSEFSLTSWGGFAAPAGTPQEILRLLAATLTEIAAEPEVQARFQGLAARLISSTNEQILARMDRERPVWGELVRISGARSQ